MNPVRIVIVFFSVGLLLGGFAALWRQSPDTTAVGASLRPDRCPEPLRLSADALGAASRAAVRHAGNGMRAVSAALAPHDAAGGRRAKACGARIHERTVVVRLSDGERQRTALVSRVAPERYRVWSVQR